MIRELLFKRQPSECRGVRYASLSRGVTSGEALFDAVSVEARGEITEAGKSTECASRWERPRLWKSTERGESGSGIAGRLTAETSRP
jgi:hypothetical protein